MPDINRRMFVATGASLLATSASITLLREASAAPQETAQDLMREIKRSAHPSGLHTAGSAMPMDAHPMGEDMTRCILHCQDCHTLCIQMIGHCLKLGGRYADPDHIRLLMDCAQMCTTTIDYLARKSPIHGRLCGLCAEICRLCAESCERVGEKDEMMRQCAEQCLSCATSCERMTPKRTT